MPAPFLLLMAVGLLVAANDPKDELKKLEGTWTVVALEKEGVKEPEKVVKEVGKLTIKGNKFVLGTTTKREATFTLDPAKTPKTFDLVGFVRAGRTSPGIYELDGDHLKICFGEQRPTTFKTAADAKTALIVARRDKP